MRVLALFLFVVLTVAAQAASDLEVRTVQRALLDAGYDVRIVDGKQGNWTIAAIRRYQADWELPVSGKITGELISRVTRAHARTKPGTIITGDQRCRFHNPFPQARETVTHTGSCIDGLPEGNGKSVWRFILNGEWQQETYEGDMVNGKRTGHGLSVWHDGERYEGGWQNNLRDGAGVSEWPDGNQYFGEWRQNKRHGHGILIWNNDDRYVGEWLGGERTGNGTYIWANGDRYDGDFVDNKRQGFGVFLSDAGNRYEGEFADNRPDGHIVLTETDGSVHSGKWEQGCFSKGEVRRWLGKTRQACGFD